MSWPSNTMRPAVGSSSRITSAGECRFAAARLRRPGRRSRRGTRRRSTPSTARSTRCGSKKFSRGSGKCLARPRTCSSGVGAIVPAAWRLTRDGGRRVQRLSTLCDPASCAATTADRQQLGMLVRMHRWRTGSGHGSGSPAGQALASGGWPSIVAKRRSPASPIQSRRGMQQRPCVRMARIGQQVLRATFLDHLAGIHHQHARTDCRRSHRGRG